MDTNSLRQFLIERFSDSELRTLCAELGIEYEGLTGTNRDDKARELVAFCERRGEFERLETIIRAARPSIFIPQIPSGASTGQTFALKHVHIARRKPTMISTPIDELSKVQFERLFVKIDELTAGLSEVRTQLALLTQKTDQRISGLEISVHALTTARASSWQVYLFLALSCALVLLASITFYALNMRG